MAVAEEFAFEPTGSHRRRLLYALAALVLIGVGVASYMLVSAGSGSTPAAVTTTATVTTGNLVSSYTTTGTASATTSAQLSFSSTGAVKEVDVKPGDTVKSGQVLAKLDDTTIQRQIQTAQTNLQVAQLKLAQLMQPTADTVAAAQQSVTQANAALTTAQTNLQAAVNPSAADLAAAQQAVAQAQAGLATAQGNLTTAQAGPTASDLAAAQQAVDQAQVGLGNAQNGVGSAWTNLVAAQTNYCTNVSWFPVMPCQQADLPLTQASITGLNNELEFPIGTKADITTSNQAVSQFLSANTAYGSAQANVPPAQQALAVAREKLKDLTAPPNATTLTQLQSAVTAAQQGLTSAQTKLALLQNPDANSIAQLQAAVQSAQQGVTAAQAKLSALTNPDANTIAQQQASVTLAQIGLQQAQDAESGATIVAPFDGTVSAVSYAVGSPATATSSITVTDPNGMSVALTVSESDLPGLQVGQLGVATFTALPSNSYIVKIVSISTTPTVTQGVVTYPVQAEILRGASLQDNATQITQLLRDIASSGARSSSSSGTTGGTGAGGFFFGGGGGGGGGAGGAGAAGGGGGGARGDDLQAATPVPSPSARGRRAGASATPGAGSTGGIGGTPGSGTPATGSGTGAQNFLDRFTSEPLPDAGMSASVTVVEKVDQNVLLVPSTAIKTQGRTSYVDLQKNGTTTTQRVVTGDSDSTNTVIVSGLSAGDKVVIGGAVAVPTRASGTRTPGAGGFGGGSGGGTGGGLGGASNGGGSNSLPGGVR